MGLSFVKGKKGAAGSTALAGLGIIFLLALKSKLASDAVSKGGGAIQVNYEAGYYLSLVFLLAAVGTGIHALMAGKDKSTKTDHDNLIKENGEWKDNP